MNTKDENSTPAAGQLPNLNADRAKEIITYAWNYFDFHAKQRTQMFNFFILSAGVLASAVGLLLRTTDYKDLAAVPLYAGTILSLAFLALDVRNTQLLQMGEDTLDALERWFLFQDLPDFNNRDGKTVTLGLISRENDWESQLRRERDTLKQPSKLIHYINYNRVKHKMAIRFAESTAFFLFLSSASYSLSTGALSTSPIACKYGITIVLASLLVFIWYLVLSLKGMRVEGREQFAQKTT